MSARELSEASRTEPGAQLTHEIYEGDTPYPVVTHVFKGKTREEAEGYFKAHMKTDEFMAAMEKDGRWKDIKGRTKKAWSDAR